MCYPVKSHMTWLNPGDKSCSIARGDLRGGHPDIGPLLKLWGHGRAQGAMDMFSYPASVTITLYIWYKTKHKWGSMGDC